MPSIKKGESEETLKDKTQKDRWYRGASINRAGLVIYGSPLTAIVVYSSNREDRYTKRY